MSTSPRQFILLLVALIVGFGTAWQLASAQADKPTALQKWEYTTTRDVMDLDRLSKGGWEIGWVTGIPGASGNGEIHFTLKRAKTGP